MASRPDRFRLQNRPVVWAAGLAMLAGTAAAQPAITGAWARATVPGQDSGVAYLTIVSPVPDTLTGAASPAAGMVMLHRSTRGGGMAGMADVPALALPAGQKVVLAPGGLHLMLTGLHGSLRAGSRLGLDLIFAHAGRVHVDAPVMPIGIAAPAG